MDLTNPNEVPTNAVIDRLTRRIAQLELDNTVLQIALEQAVSAIPVQEPGEAETDAE